MSMMQIEGPADQPFEDEFDVLSAMLPLAGARVLELGCGTAEKTRRIAERIDVADIVATEVDLIQHEKNVRLDDLSKVTFKLYGAEAIDEPDGVFDCVMMFKSLHHVPVSVMAQALAEIFRVLKPGGLAYISEPVFSGNYSEIVRLFHDEEAVQREAFKNVKRVVENGLFELVEERFFKSQLQLRSFAQFEEMWLNFAHPLKEMSAEVLAEVRAKFESYRGEEEYVFEKPVRVDLLRKPAAR